MPRKTTTKKSAAEVTMTDLEIAALESTIHSVISESQPVQVMFCQVLIYHPVYERHMYVFSPLTAETFSKYQETAKSVLVYLHNNSIDGNIPLYISTDLILMYRSI